MSRVPHKTTSPRRIIISREWAERLGVHRHTIRKLILKYEKLEGRKYNANDIISVLGFYDFVMNYEK